MSVLEKIIFIADYIEPNRTPFEGLEKTSTWGDGELQDDWYDAIKMIKTADLNGKIVALFGCGDSESYCIPK